MITNNQQLCAFLHRIKDETELAIDTEFKRVSSYYPLLCLVQIATKDIAECIDILAIKDLTPLFEKLYQQDCLWVVHSARQDIEAMYCLSQQLPKCLFDTQVAVDLLKNIRPENSNPSAQISYQALTEILQGVTLEKAYTRLDWTTRPLPEAAIEYALDDVRYLIKNYQQLKIRLKDEKKLAWLMEEGQSLLAIHLYDVDITQAWQRIKGFSRLPKHAHSVAVQLSAWREKIAINKNKPRKWILSDENLIDIALGKDNLNQQKQCDFSNFCLTHPQLSDIKINTRKYSPITAEEKAQKVILQKIIQEKANQYNLTAEVIATSKTLLKYIRGDQSVNFLNGWRYQLLQNDFDNGKFKTAVVEHL